jgi:hypothetical protein
MNRRKALSLTATLLGSTIIGSEVLLSGCSIKEGPVFDPSQEQIDLLDMIGETILPETEQSHGAKAAQIGKFMKSIVADCYDQEEQTSFTDGMDNIASLSLDSYGSPFAEMSEKDRLELLSGLEEASRANAEEGSTHYYVMMKQLTIWGYFSSEIGSREALRFNPVPGRFDGCIPYVAGEKAWA